MVGWHCACADVVVVIEVEPQPQLPLFVPLPLLLPFPPQHPELEDELWQPHDPEPPHAHFEQHAALPVFLRGTTPREFFSS
jgi:hypothetical protein